MNKLSIFLLTAVCTLSCGQPQSNKTKLTVPELQAQCAEVLFDEKTSWIQVQESIAALGSALMTASDNEDDLGQRLAAQQASYMTIGLLSEKIEALRAEGEIIEESDIETAFNELLYPSMVWFYDADEQIPNIWRDQYYRSNQNSEKPVSGYFHLMLTLPSPNEPESCFHVFFPDSAESAPKFIFRKYKDEDCSEEDWETQFSIEPKHWTAKDEGEEGFPLHVALTAEETSRILDYDILYISYLSASAPSGEIGEREMARIELEPLKIIRQEVLFE